MTHSGKTLREIQEDPDHEIVLRDGTRLSARL